MENGEIRILQLEDSEVDAEIIRSELKRSGLRFEVRRESGREGFLAALRDFRPDIVLADFALPSYDGLSALREAREARPGLPFIFVTGNMGEDLAVESLKAGATDFVVKNSLGRLFPAIRRALRETAAATERRRAESELELLKAAVDQAGEIIFITDTEGAIVFVNPAFEAATGYSRQEALGKNPRILRSGKQDEAFYRELWETVSSGLTWKGRLVNKRKDGTLYTEDATVSPVRSHDGRIVNYAAVKRDVTDQLRLQEQFFHSQKMEAVGRLAGGIAHDFNNTLTAIMGFSDFLLKSIPSEDPRYEDACEIKAAAQRAAALTRQLLVFSRKHVFQAAVLDANAVVPELMKMLQRVIGEDVALEFLPCQEACRVNADAGLLEQVVMNLVVNARDAMPRGGRITIATAQVALGDLAGRSCPDLMPGPYAVLSVSDTGLGMDAGTMKRVFEPFFTTKGPGQGTGLGLSTVYGIVRQSGGGVTVESSPGNGSTFKVWLPSVAEAPKPGPAAEPDSAGPGGAETILVLDDDPQVRKVIARSLGLNGYRTLEAATSQEAIDLCSREPAIDLLLSDMILSDADRGPEVARRLVALAPKMRIVFMSGYTDERLDQEELLSLADAFFQKPVSPETLSLKVREVLDSPRRAISKGEEA